MRQWILRIHLYGGLLCAPYLIIFGFSSLHFNHHFAFVIMYFASGYVMIHNKWFRNAGPTATTRTHWPASSAS